MYAWSFNIIFPMFEGECETVEEALKEARKEADRLRAAGEDVPMVVYIGEMKYYTPGPELFDVLESISDDCYDETCCDDYLTDVPENEEEELQAALQKTFLEWAKKHGYNPEKIWSVPYSTVRKVMLWRR